MSKTETETETAKPSGWADSKDAWFGRVHDAVLPSGVKVTYRDLTLAEMARVGDLPSELLEIAIAEWSDPGAAARMAVEPLQQLPEEPTDEQQETAEAEMRQVLERISAVNRHLIAAALVDPVLTVEELERVPVADLELLTALINRNAAVDAAGRHVGVVPVDQFQVVLGAHGHKQCDPDCQACEEARRGLATPR